MPGDGTPGPVQGPVTEKSSLIDLTSLFSAPEGQPRRSAAASPPPATQPFQAPDFGDFGEDDTVLLEDVQEPVTAVRTARRKGARSRG
nr:hypothetical protein StreXyl84_30820 [Streptomyces sp. Xyl84]